MIELWAGPECTVCRVGDVYRDEIALTGHDTREDDLDRLAWLGARSVRQPVLLEKNDLEWAARRLERIRALGMNPIVTLVHHGSGPPDTSLVDPSFVDRVARWARIVAERFPWVRDYTPINEPLTTARFSTLYGHWYPHARDDAMFARAIVYECSAIARAMEAIRAIRSDARLVQTEDLGKTFSTPDLRDQADFDNERRWLSFDLLCGRVTEGHPLYEFLRGARAPDFSALHCPPDVVGINYYTTSDRFLDTRLDRYPPHTHGGNHRVRYADVEAVRAREDGIAGHERVLLDAWERYGIPVAIAEAHLGCTREEQARWLVRAWKGAHAARARGADVRAVTVWSAFGAFDWDSLLTESRGTYEPGAFDVRFDPPRPTLVAHVARDLAKSGTCAHPVLDDPGWWERPSRRSGSPHVVHTRGRPIAICGAGTLGRALADACTVRGLAHVLLSRSELDITNEEAIRARIRDSWAVINAAGYVRVDDAEGEPDRCTRENVEGALALARACEDRAYVTISSDLVFDGESRAPYLEDARTNPLNVYGTTKERMEREVLAIHSNALVVRTAAFFAPGAPADFVTRALRAFSQGDPFVCAEDVIVSPTHVGELVHAMLDLLCDGERGTWHLANEGAISWADLARIAAERANVRPRTLVACSIDEMNLKAKRPRYSALASQRGTILGPFEDALARSLS